MTVTRRQHIEALARLDEAPDAAERVARFRKGLATLAATVQGMRRSLPLEGIRPDRLLTSVRAAFAAGLFEDLDWLSPAARVAARCSASSESVALSPSFAKSASTSAHSLALDGVGVVSRRSVRRRMNFIGSPPAPRDR